MKHLFLLTVILFTFAAQSVQAQAEEPFFVSVDQMPEFSSGQKGLGDYIRGNLSYPREALDAKVEGIVIASFIVEKDGSISNIGIVKGLGHGCDEEVVRLIKMMPNWTPGQKDGKAVRVKLTIPVQFNLS
ncbi:MAG: energy transducer TonB [Bacteroidales bacterium]|jgi:protein TonB|nr:energy transducer TonB [Bacteroidales bacterium]